MEKVEPNAIPAATIRRRAKKFPAWYILFLWVVSRFW